MNFKVGDKVRVKSLDWYNENKDENGIVDGTIGVVFIERMNYLCGQVLTITDVETDCYSVKESDYRFADFMLEDDVVKEEPLDLTKILEECEGIELWSPIYGKVKLEQITDNMNPIVVSPIGRTIIIAFRKDGYLNNIHDETADIMLFPSKGQRDWSKFKKPRWRAKDGEKYHFVSDRGEAIINEDCRVYFDNERYDCGNYFRTKEEAKEYAEKVREIFKERL